MSQQENSNMDHVNRHLFSCLLCLVLPQDIDNNFIKFCSTLKEPIPWKNRFKKRYHTLTNHMQFRKYFLNLSPPIMESSLIQSNKTFNFVCIFREIHRSGCSQEIFSKWKHMTFLIIGLGRTIKNPFITSP